MPITSPTNSHPFLPVPGRSDGCPSRKIHRHLISAARLETLWRLRWCVCSRSSEAPPSGANAPSQGGEVGKKKYEGNQWSAWEQTQFYIIVNKENSPIFIFIFTTWMSPTMSEHCSKLATLRRGNCASTTPFERVERNTDTGGGQTKITRIALEFITSSPNSLNFFNALPFSITKPKASASIE